MRENEVSKMVSAILTSSGRITIPKEIRERMRFRTGQCLDFRIGPHRVVVIRPRPRDVRELKGIVRTRRRKPVSLEDMNEAIARGFGGDIKRPR